MSNLEDEQDTQQNESTAESREGWRSGRLVWRHSMIKSIELHWLVSKTTLTGLHELCGLSKGAK